MQFNGNTDGYDCVTIANDLANANNNSFPLAQKARFATMIMNTIWSWIFEVYGGWQYDDSNYTATFPSALTTLTTNQLDYGLPSEALTVRGVDILLPGGNVWQPLEKITEEQIREGYAEKQFLISAGVPRFYRPEGNSLKIYPKANYTIPNGLRATFDRAGVAFVSTDTTKQPGFASNLHEAVPTGMAMMYAKIKHLDTVQSLSSDFMVTAKKAIQIFYKKRYQEMYPPQITVVDATREFM